MSAQDFSKQGFSTRVIHPDHELDPAFGAVNAPIYATSTFAQDGVGGLKGGYEYSRSANPTRTALEKTIAASETAQYARAFSSGLAATDAVLRSLVKPGDHLVIPHDAYGGTFRLVDKILRPWGVAYSIAKSHEPQAFVDQITPQTKAVWVETPSNPLLSITDIAALAEAAREAGVALLVDNTFASPYLQRPLELGARAVVHSATKYLGGHSDVIGGAVVTNDAELDAAVGFLQNGSGAVPSPFDAFLIRRGMLTLGVRVRRQSESALAIAEHLAGHPKVSQVLYPGLAGDPGHAVASKQMHGGFGGMLSVRLKAGEQAALDLCAHTNVFILGESLGGVESLIEHPARMTHASVVGSDLEVPSDLVRLSVGLEDVEDLIADLDQALG
ncbi:MAG: cystathionine gamma-synthase [Segniliparus sp.]|uniref:cystathionine gamma-synthase n=1 Tax=Segniliparus sp. TaxID=2804064 RepID=UPI003F30AA83